MLLPSLLLSDKSLGLLFKDDVEGEDGKPVADFESLLLGEVRFGEEVDLLLAMELNLEINGEGFAVDGDFTKVEVLGDLGLGDITSEEDLVSLLTCTTLEDGEEGKELLAVSGTLGEAFGEVGALMSNERCGIFFSLFFPFVVGVVVVELGFVAILAYFMCGTTTSFT